MVDSTISADGNLSLALRAPDARLGRHYGYDGDALTNLNFEMEEK